MNIIVNLLGKVVTILDLKKEEVIALIENDFGLIRYILKIFREYELSKTNGYLQFQNKERETYLHRIVLEYYAQFDIKLFTILNNPSEYEVNHKNKKKWDNRLENLELVTQTGNERHKKGFNYEKEIVMSTEEIIQIKERLQQNKQYQADKKYLEKVNHRNIEYLKKGQYFWDCNRKFYDNLYIRFNNITFLPQNILSTTTYINTLESFSSSVFQYIKNTLLSTNNIIDLSYNYDKYRVRNILENNLKLLYKYYNKNKYFREVTNKYNLINYSKDDLSYNILIDFYYLLSTAKLPINFSKNQLYITVSVKDFTLAYGKYNSFKVLYYLQLLQRKRVCYKKKEKEIIPFLNLKGISKNSKRKISSFIIPKYTDKLFTTIVLPLSKFLYQQKLTTITHTILTKNNDLSTADRVYQNSYRTKKTKESLITITDIENLLSTVLLPKIELYGFITINDIRKELQHLNHQRKMRGQPFREIKDTDTKFISKMINNLTEIKQLMNQFKIVYKPINQNTKEKINQYQLKNGIEEPTTIGLTYRQKIIILKKLSVDSKKVPKKRRKSVK